MRSVPRSVTVVAWSIVATAAVWARARRPPASAFRSSRTFRELRTVSVAIDGREHALLFDTGGGRTLVAPAVAERIGCQPSGRDVGYRMSGEPVVFQNCDRLEARMGAYPLRLAPVAVFDVGALLPKELPPLDGVLALDAFRGQVVSLDWAASLVTVHSSTEAAAALRDHGVPSRFATGENGASLTALLPVPAMRGPNLWFLLDSGNIRGTLVAPHVRNERALAFPSDSTASIGIGAGAPRAHDVSITDINYDGVLGTAFLRSTIVTLDLRRAP